MGITIVGEAPSQFSDPKRPFDGASGERLAFLAGLNDLEMLESRATLANVLSRWPGRGYAGEKGSKFPSALAKKKARRFELRGVFVLAGRRVARAFDVGLGSANYFSWHVIENSPVPRTRAVPPRSRFPVGRQAGRPDCWIAVIPHPSGCNRFWNYEENTMIATMFMRGLFARVR